MACRRRAEISSPRRAPPVPSESGGGGLGQLLSLTSGPCSWAWRGSGGGRSVGCPRRATGRRQLDSADGPRSSGAPWMPPGSEAGPPLSNLRTEPRPPLLRRGTGGGARGRIRARARAPGIRGPERLGLPWAAPSGGGPRLCGYNVRASDGALSAAGLAAGPRRYPARSRQHSTAEAPCAVRRYAAPHWRARGGQRGGHTPARSLRKRRCRISGLGAGRRWQCTAVT